tara:strand:+ start:697 stop:954 length:258 start_codon:yes stop_codon:yes gene_type:complete
MRKYRVLGIMTKEFEEFVQSKDGDEVFSITAVKRHELAQFKDYISQWESDEDAEKVWVPWELERDGECEPDRTNMLLEKFFRGEI